MAGEREVLWRWLIYTHAKRQYRVDQRIDPFKAVTCSEYRTRRYTDLAPRQKDLDNRNGIIRKYTYKINLEIVKDGRMVWQQLAGRTDWKIDIQPADWTDRIDRQIW